MEEELKALYELELKHLQTHADEFASREPYRQIATRLGLNPDASLRDPFVEWLLQGYAFLSARARFSLEAEFPRFTQNLLSIVYPHLHAPTPSMIVAELKARDDPALLSGPTAPRGMRMVMPVRSGGARSRTRKVTFTTGRAVRLWPIRVKSARYVATSVERAGGSRDAPAAIEVTLAVTPQDTPLAALEADEIDLFLANVEGGGGLLYEALACATTRCELAGAPGAPPISVSPVGLDQRASSLDPDAGDEARDALLPYDLRSFEGWRLLHEFFALPSRFHFIRLGGLRRAFAGCEGAEAKLLFLLDKPMPSLAGKLGREAIRPNCVPAINLFRHNADEIRFTERKAEHLIMSDRGDPTAYEVHSVLGVTGRTSDGADVAFRPFFSADAFGAREARGQRYFHVSRRARERPLLREEREEGLDLYKGSEAYLSIVDETAAPVIPDLRALSLELLCTNRHLAAHAALASGATRVLTSELDLGWEEIRVVAGPSAPRSGLPEGRALWDALSHLSLNYLSLIDTTNSDGKRGDAAPALRQLMGIYAGHGEVAGETLIGALRRVSARPVVRRIAPNGNGREDRVAPMAFARGLEVSLEFDKDVPAAATLTAVLDRVLARHADVNSFVQTVLRRPDGTERARWAARAGTRPQL